MPNFEGPLSAGISVDNERFIFTNTNGQPGSSQDQASVGNEAVDRTEYTQAAATGSDGAGGSYRTVLGAKDGIGGLSNFAVARELTPGGTSFDAFTITPGAASTDPTTLFAIGGVIFDAGIRLNSTSITNKASGGAIGTAAATVDQFNMFAVRQTTAGQALTFPTPSNTTSGTMGFVVNSGTVSFTMYGKSVPTGGLLIGVYDNEGGTGAPAWRVASGAAAAGDVGNVQVSDGAGGFAGDYKLSWTASSHILAFDAYSQITTLSGGLSLAPFTDLVMNAGGSGNLHIGNGSGGSIHMGRAAATTNIDGRVIVNSTGDMAINSTTAINMTAYTDCTWQILGDLTDTRMLNIDSSYGVNIGPTNAVSITIGNTNSSTFVAGDLEFQGSSFNLSPLGGGSITPTTNLSLDPHADLHIGDGSAASIFLGKSGTPITLKGNVTYTLGALSLSPNAASSLATSAGALTLTSAAAATWKTSAGALTVDSAAALNIGTSVATSVAVGKSGITTTVTGGLTQLTGAVSLTGNAASSLVTSAGALTLTSAAAATWSTAAGALSLQAATDINITALSGVVKIPGLGTVVSTAVNYNAGTGAIGPVTSSLRFKENVTDMTVDSNKIFSLVPVSYNRKDTKDVHEFGYIAEDVVNVLPEIVPLDIEGLPYSVNYDKIVVLLVEEMRKLKNRVDTMSKLTN